MSLAAKIILAVLVLGIVLFGVAFGTSRYLVSRLDGMGGVSAPQENMQRYSSEDGVEFQYPDRYELSSHTLGNAERQWDVLLLLPAGYVPPTDGEGPPAISLSIFQNPEGYPLRQWVEGDARSNWKLTIDDRASTTTIVGGEPALWYHYSGLYETDTVAVARGGKIFLFSVGWLAPTDQIRRDFQTIIGTVQFNP